LRIEAHGARIPSRRGAIIHARLIDTTALALQQAASDTHELAQGVAALDLPQRLVDLL
jgi:hypothetical protein